MEPRYAFSIFTKPYRHLSADDLAKKIAGIGFSGIEFPLRDGYQAEPADADVSLPRLATCLARYAIQITSVASCLDERVFAGCARANVPYIRVMISHDLQRNFYDEMQEQRDYLLNKAKYCRQYGVKVVVQHHYGPGVNNSMELAWFLEPLDPDLFGAVWDAAHSALAGEEPEQALDILWPRLSMVNFKNARYVRKDDEGPFERYFTTGQDGLAAWPRAVNSMVARGYRGPVCLTAEYTDETHLDDYAVEDLSYVKALFKEAADRNGER